MQADFAGALQREQADIISQIAELDGEIQRIRAETEEKIASLQERREQLQAKMRHIQALLTLEGVSAKDSLETISVRAVDNGRFAGSASLADAAHALLMQTANEMHYREIVNALKSKGIDVPGQDPGINLVAHIHDDPRFIRPRRGVYGLKEWYPTGVKSVGVRKQTRKRAATRRR